ncbi:Synaptotagmin-17 [Portunus trituberculatus]|uniref:Synaptotagmin-17 n=1 Tax=Portunus trituberculatus TaxID=210409 RepID=A0A5B7E7T3_PORTR|nr:Synaptotagmin-17 [Portunus trituberculatus]
MATHQHHCAVQTLKLDGSFHSDAAALIHFAMIEGHTQALCFRFGLGSGSRNWSTTRALRVVAPTYPYHRFFRPECSNDTPLPGRMGRYRAMQFANEGVVGVLSGIHRPCRAETSVSSFHVGQTEEPSSDSTPLVVSLRHQRSEGGGAAAPASGGGKASAEGRGPGGNDGGGGGGGGDSGDLTDSESLSTTSLLRQQSNSSSPSSSVSSVKDLKSDIYHQIRPHLYASTSSSLEEGPDEDQLGRIHFSLHYDALAAVLRVKVIEAMDLPRPACKDRNDLAHSNPYVKVSLLPDTKNSLQTSVKKKTQDPLFEETFTFEVPYKEVVRRTLELKVKDFDKFSRHCVVGHALLPLQKVNLARSSRHWQPLTPCNLETEEYGEILLSLNYLPTAGRLNVDVIKAKQLLQTNLVRGADPYVRVSLVVRGRHLKSKKTSVRKNTLTPSFNESFSFHVTSSELREASLVITAWDWNGGVMRDEFIGRAVLGKQPSGPNEMTHWTNMMGSQRHAVAQWHSLHARSHCDQVSSASRAVP